MNAAANVHRRSLWKGPALVTALLLLIPLLGDLFVEGWSWKPGGFVVFGALVFGAALTFQRVTRDAGSAAYRAAVGIALAAAFVLFWMNFVQAADDMNPHAVWYFGVPLVGVVGAAVARLRPTGMARALFATALAQALVLAAMLMVVDLQTAPGTAAVLRGLGLNAALGVLFVGSALLFRAAARGAAAPRAA